jgi:hypothetical protein
MSNEKEKERDGSMDLWPEWPNGERWASPPRTGILPLSKSGMSESGREKMGFFRRCGSLNADGLRGMEDGCLRHNEQV